MLPFRIDEVLPIREVPDIRVDANKDGALVVDDIESADTMSEEDADDAPI